MSKYSLLESSLSSFRTGLNSVRLPTSGSPAGDIVLVQLDNFTRKEFYRAQKKRKETLLTMSFASAASSTCIIGLKNVCILAFEEQLIVVPRSFGLCSSYEMRFAS